MAANIDVLVESLETTSDVLSTLLELKAALSSVATNNLEGCVSEQHIRRIFSLFNTEDNEVIEECCSILKVALQAFSPDGALQLFQSDFELGLQNQSTTIQCLCLGQLEFAGTVEMNWESATETIKTVINMISSPSLQVAKLAQNVIFNICTSCNSIDLVYSDMFRNSIDDILQKDDTVKYRFYELLVNISKTSESALQKTQQRGLLQQLINEVHKEDILAQLNCLELLSNLGMVEHGIVFLDQTGVIKQLETKLAESVSDPMGGLLLPGLVKFFGGVAHFYPKEVLSENKTFVDVVLDNLSSNDKNLCSLSVQTIGLIGKYTEGKLALDKLGNRFIDGLHTVGRMIKHAPTELREITLQSTANLILVPVGEQTSELCQLTENWFNHLDTNMLQIIMSIAKQPFPELRLSAHGLLSVLAELPWGQKKMCEFPGFNEYLLDRSTEKSKEGKESKFELIRTLANSPTTQDIFGQPYYVQLKAYSLQGAYYIQTESQVAFEGD